MRHGHLVGSVVERYVVPARLLAVLDHEVSQHAEDEREQKNDDLDVDAGDATVTEGDDEADGLPQTVVGERSLSLGPREHLTVEG